MCCCSMVHWVPYAWSQALYMQGLSDHVQIQQQNPTVSLPWIVTTSIAFLLEMIPD